MNWGWGWGEHGEARGTDGGQGSEVKAGGLGLLGWVEVWVEETLRGKTKRGLER